MKKLCTFTEPAFFSYLEEQFEDLYNRFFGEVHSIATYYHPEKADDVTADIFIKKIYKAVQKGKFQSGAERRLIIRIAHNYCKTVYRLNKGKMSKQLEEMNTLPILENPYLSIDFSIDFKRALEQLPTFQKLAISLSLEGYNDKEIGKQLQKSTGAVRQLKKRAKKGIKKFFRD